MKMDSHLIKALALSKGASLVGIANVERFEGAPPGHGPADFVPGAKSVVVIGVRLLPAVVEWTRLFRRSQIMTGDVRRLVAQDHVYMRCAYHIINDRLNDIALDVAYALQDAGHETIFLPATYSHEAEIMRKVPGFLAPFSHRHAAVRAGLGGFGLSNLVVTPEYGPRIRFTSVITAASLQADPLLMDRVCPGQTCGVCVRECKVSALVPRTDASGIRANLDMPSCVDKEACLGAHGEVGCTGTCLRVCPIGL